MTTTASGARPAASATAGDARPAMSPMIVAIVRRAILDLLADIGGEHNDETIAILLAELGHRVARSVVAEQLAWLAERKLVHAEKLGPYMAARALPDGRDVAAGRLVIDGVRPHKTGE